MRILGRAYKENLILGISMVIILTGIFIFLGIFLLDISIARIIVSSFFFILACFCVVYFSILIYLQIKTKENVILFDEENKKFTVNSYHHSKTFRLEEVEKINYHNKGLLSASIIIFPFEFSFGKISFILKNGTKIITPNIDDVIETFKTINEIIKIK